MTSASELLARGDFIVLDDVVLFELPDTVVEVFNQAVNVFGLLLHAFIKSLKLFVIFVCCGDVHYLDLVEVLTNLNKAVVAGSSLEQSLEFFLADTFFEVAFQVVKSLLNFKFLLVDGLVLHLRFDIVVKDLIVELFGTFLLVLFA